MNIPLFLFLGIKQRIPTPDYGKCFRWIFTGFLSSTCFSKISSLKKKKYKDFTLEY